MGAAREPEVADHPVVGPGQEVMARVTAQGLEPALVTEPAEALEKTAHCKPA